MAKAQMMSTGMRMCPAGTIFVGMSRLAITRKGQFHHVGFRISGRYITVG